jgi:hypothetical protein
MSLKYIDDIYNQLKHSAKKRGIEFTITKYELIDFGVPITCPVLGIPIKFNRGKAEDNSISVDRIDSTKGYSKDNIVIVSNRVNRIKNNATLEELKLIVKFYSELDYPPQEAHSVVSSDNVVLANTPAVDLI